MDFEVFYRQEYERVVRALIAASGDRELARDAAQEAFARAFARWGRLTGEEWVSGWVITTGLNYCRRHHARFERRRTTSGPSDSPAPATDSRLDIESAIRTLRPRQRQAVILYYVADLPIAAVAAAMGIGDGAVKSHLSRARARLRNDLRLRDD